MPRLIKSGEPLAARRRLYWQLVGVDGISPALDEDGGQPEVSIDGDSWVGGGSIGVLTGIGNGRYYADLDSSSVVTSAVWIESRYKSDTTAECPGDSAFVVSHDEALATAQILGLLTASGVTVTVSGPEVSDAGEFTITIGDDYYAVDGTSFRQNVETGIDLTTQTLKMYVYKASLEGYGLLTTDGLDCTATLVSAGVYRVETDIPASVTGLMTPGGKHKFEVKRETPRVTTFYKGYFNATP